ncbi:unnamed protein product [Choristocarpus tenellus]
MGNRYRNSAGMGGSGPLAAASRYGACGTLRMLRRDVTASGRYTNPEDICKEGFQVNEWSPPLQSKLTPSLASFTTPKAWPRSAAYPHGSAPKCLEPSPWFDGETTTNSVHKVAAGAGSQRSAAKDRHVNVYTYPTLTGLLFRKEVDNSQSMKRNVIRAGVLQLFVKYN